jgi:acetylornithine/succinyldiaminopimelate/putrescine aminotransferase
LVPGIRHIGFNSFEDIAMINERTAAVIVEPIQAEAGVVIPAPGFLKAVRNRCNQTGTLLIFDEIQTGMGRTGSMWAFEQENVVPDILLLAKAFGGGLPLGAFISSPEIMSALSHNPILGHMTTFGGHPLSCAASLEALQIVLDDQLQDRAIALGDLFKAKLKPHPALHEIRGRGLMLALELKNQDHLLPAVKACRANGLLVDWFLFNDRSIRLAPPLITSEVEVMLICDKLTAALNTLYQ